MHPHGLKLHLNGGGEMSSLPLSSPLHLLPIPCFSSTQNQSASQFSTSLRTSGVAS